MRLIGAHFHNYRRFRGEASIDLDPQVVAIVGPNEAGKSSLLDALQHLDHDGVFDPLETTRGTPAGTTVSVVARFLVEDDEKELIAGIPEASEVRQLLITKPYGGVREYSLEPEPRRDLERRRQADDWVRRLRGPADWLPSAEEDPDEAERVSALLDQALEILGSESESLNEVELEALRSLRSEMEEQPPPYVLRGLPARLDALISYEETHPSQRAIDLLKPLVPRIRKFGDPERDLSAVYDLGDPADPDVDDGPAIRNLLIMAGTTYEGALAVAQSGNRGQQEVWLDRTKAQLRENFSRAWRQSELEVRLYLDGMSLTVLMSMHAEDFIEIDQRSDGLRQFVALRSFVMIDGSALKPVVLIDEAETHLHYDAQADLVQVLEEQEETAKVIYTTHSAGCLPRDLGTGVRAVVPVQTDVDGVAEQTDDSAIIDRFWTQGQGFSPVLIAMGASAFAFSAARKAVVAEGMSDVLLLLSATACIGPTATA